MNIKFKLVTQKLLLASFFFVTLPVSSAIYLENNDQKAIKENLLFKTNPISSISNFIQQETSTKEKINYELVLNLIEQKKNAQAMVQVNELIKQHPKQASLHSIKALLYIFDKKNDLAKHHFKKAIELKNNSLFALVSLAKLALHEKNYGQAKQFANKALEYEPNSKSAYNAIADAINKQQGIDAVESFLQEAISKNKGDSNVELTLIKILRKIHTVQKQPKKTIPLIENIVNRHQNNPDILSFYVDTLLTNQNKEKAEQILRQLILQNQKDGKHLLLLAQILGSQSGRETEAFKLLSRAENNHKISTLALALKSGLYLKLKQYQKALDVATHVTKTFPKLSIGFILKGNTLQSQKKYDQALKAYQIAYKMTPSSTNMDKIIKTLSLQKKSKKIKLFLESESIKHPDNGLIQLRLADVYLKSGDHEKSIKTFNLLLSRDHKNPLVLNNLAWAYLAAKNIKMALETSKKAHLITPKSSTTLDTYGYMLLNNGDVQTALPLLQEAMKINPENKGIQLRLAKAYLANKQNKKAMTILIPLSSEKSHIQNKAKKLLQQSQSL